jgi:HK97 family phage major capsid protein
MENLTDKEKEFAAHVNSEVVKTIESFKSGVMTVEAFNTKMTELQKENPKIAELEAALLAQGTEMKALKEGKASQHKSLYTRIRETLEANKDKLKALQEQKQGFSLEIKQAGDMTSAVVSGVQDVRSTQIDTQIAPVALNAPLIMAYANVVPTSSSQIVYIDETSPEGTCVITAENVAVPQLDMPLTATTVLAKQIGGFIKVSERMIQDMDWLAAQITGLLVSKLEKDADAAICTTGATGLEAIAPAYTNTDLNDLVADANRVDALIAMIGQIRAANFEPNLIVVKPMDLSIMYGMKATTGQYQLIPSLFNGGSFTLLGIPVIWSNVLETGHALVADMTKVHVAVYNSTVLEWGMEGTDFIDYMRTIRAKKDIMWYVKTNELPALCYDAFATVQAALETP